MTTIASVIVLSVVVFRATGAATLKGIGCDTLRNLSFLGPDRMDDLLKAHF
jgi:hypothetical protein